VAGNALADAAVGVDDGGDAVVGVAQDPAAVLDGAHADHVEVLPGGAGVAVPAVVADVDEDFGAELGEVAHLVGEDRLIADEDAVAVGFTVRGGETEDFAVFATCERGDPAGEFTGKLEQVGEGNVLAEGDEMDLVVAADADAICRDDEGGVKVVCLLVCRVGGGGAGRPADVADDQGRVRGVRYAGESFLKSRIGLIEGGGRLRPDYEIRRSGNAGRRTLRMATGDSVCGRPSIKLLHCSPARRVNWAMCCSHSPGPSQRDSSPTLRSG
jgi:hypothetical protein